MVFLHTNIHKHTVLILYLQLFFYIYYTYMPVKVVIRIVIILFLVGCAQDMPYGYYQLVGLVCFIGFGFLGYLEFKSNNYILVVFLSILTLLFNPIIKVSFKKSEWITIDGFVIIALMLWLIFDVVILFVRKLKNNEKRKKEKINA